jgi:hypothetical protein
MNDLFIPKYVTDAINLAALKRTPLTIAVAFFCVLSIVAQVVLPLIDGEVNRLKTVPSKDKHSSGDTPKETQS